MSKVCVQPSTSAVNVMLPAFATTSQHMYLLQKFSFLWVNLDPSPQYNIELLGPHKSASHRFSHFAQLTCAGCAQHITGYMRRVAKGHIYADALCVCNVAPKTQKLACIYRVLISRGSTLNSSIYITIFLFIFVIPGNSQNLLNKSSQNNNSN